MPIRDEIADLLATGIRPENAMALQTPDVQFPAPPAMSDVLSPHELAAARIRQTNVPRAEHPPSNLPDIAEAVLVPHTPVEYGLMAIPAAKGVSAGVKGAVLGGLAAMDTDFPGLWSSAQAGAANIARKGAQKVKQIIGIDTPAPFPQYAEQYPAAGPPTPTLKEKQPFPGAGETYDAKTLTPEAKALERTRNKIMKQMDETGFDPFFDPEKRFYVDPSKYPAANVDTLTVVPTRADTLKKYTEMIETPSTRELLNYAYDKGLELGNAKDWYAMGQLEKAFIQEYGAKEGRKNFLERFAVPMSATTSGNNPAANFALAHYFEFLRAKGIPIPEHSHQFPVTVGGRYAGTNAENYIAAMERGGYKGLVDQPKMHNFTRNFIGDLMRATMDEQMASGMLKGRSKADIDNARTTAFGMLEKPLHEEAAKRGVKPANFQDVAWAGFKGESEGPMIDVINRAIERTHRLTGMARDEILRRGIIRKEIPVYGLTGTMGGLAAQDIYQQQ